MKIALCLSGQPRGFPESLKFLVDNVIVPNNIEDIFIHSWFDENCINKTFDSSQPHLDNKVGTWHPNTVELFNQLKPKKILLESPRSFDEFSNLDNIPPATQTKLASNFYSRYTSNNLKIQYEKENNFIYDLVIVTRPDILYHNKVIVDHIVVDTQYIHVAFMHHYMRENDSYPTTRSGWNYSSLGDTFAMSSSKNIDIFSSVFPTFRQIHSDIWPYVYAEAYQGYVVRGLYNIPIIGSEQISYNLYRK